MGPRGRGERGHRGPGDHAFARGAWSASSGASCVHMTRTWSTTMCWGMPEMEARTYIVSTGGACRVLSQPGGHLVGSPVGEV